MSRSSSSSLGLSLGSDSFFLTVGFFFAFYGDSGSNTWAVTSVEIISGTFSMLIFLIVISLATLIGSYKQFLSFSN
jgi:hypothetical protein